METLAKTFTAQFRSNNVDPRIAYTRTFSVLADAVAWGFSTKQPFDISAPSGAIVWAWEMRPCRKFQLAA